jgi:hypothetical protein
LTIWFFYLIFKKEQPQTKRIELSNIGIDVSKKPEYYDEVIKHHFQEYGAELEKMSPEDLRKYRQDYMEAFNTNGNNSVAYDLSDVVEYLCSLSEEQ